MEIPDKVRPRTIVYVIHEYPPVTQTFVWREIVTARRQGHLVVAYALNRRNTPRSSDNAVWSLRDALGWKAWTHLLPVLWRVVARRKRILSLASLPPSGVAAKLRQVKALVNAAVLVQLLRSHDVKDVHFHAHFFGRTLDTLAYARVLSEGVNRGSATGHAADAANPISAQRLTAHLGELDLVVCTSESVREAMSQRVGSAFGAVVVRTGVPERSSVELLRHAQKLRVCSIGRLVEKKGFADALRAARVLRDSGVRFHWSFIGDGPLRNELVEESSDLVEGGLVTWIGYLKNELVDGFLRSEVDVVVQPSLPAQNGDIDGIPVVLMEAMSMAIPVVTTRVSGIPELVENGVTGFLCDPFDYSDIAQKLTEIDRGREAARLLGAAGRAQINRGFNDNREAARLFGAIDQLWGNEVIQRGAS